MWIDVPCRRRGSTVLRADNKNETISLRRHRGPACSLRLRGETKAARGRKRRFHGEIHRLLRPTFAPPTPPCFPSPTTTQQRGVSPPTARRASIANRRGERSPGASRHGNRRKASPGIVRNNYPPLNSTRASFHAISSAYAGWDGNFLSRVELKIHPDHRDHPNSCASWWYDEFSNAWKIVVGRRWKMFEKMSDELSDL